MEQINYKRFDWHLFWTAAGVVIPLGISFLLGFMSLKSDMKDLDKDIAIIKTVLVLKEMMPNELAMLEKK